ncbi:tRNA lysidine(34) synthetase TilS [Thermomonas carbonis]|uniref:tRNA(Ile)-lysidine synthase n=1 Tax=Thermomonas carbonis TaxID=1463158 RepID=A0A7G9SQK8_9GAMM|nr:tRNA lysidine(34) synthetase TilS [Thermomonas carbonis]QNN70133.1 tRNA lysidine(34) synthetase TilS [Thermomonas carbonis]GHB97978.1 tRNA(Ile)-lysidine synthase [Thermomonas carbonis]
MRAPLADVVRRDDRRGVLVGFSGGLDSTVLLHLLAANADIRRKGLRAIHVHHGLHPHAEAWAAHCQQTCDALGVPQSIFQVEVDRASGLGLEGAARDARHRAFAEALDDDEILALAHHREDQAETFLLRALRGSGVDGLASMRPWRAHANGWLWRPLLDVPRDALTAYAHENGLQWIEDASNGDPRFDRNFLRHAVMPLLRQRWPQASDSLARCAGLNAQAVELLDADDVSALLRTMRDEYTLDIDALRAIPRERRARVLRRWIGGLGLPPLPGNGIARIEADLLDARRDAEACFTWSATRIRRWRALLHVDSMRDPVLAHWTQPWDGAVPLRLPTGDTLSLLGADRFDQPLQVHARQGGERIVLPGRDHSHALKNVLREVGIPPWQRERLPLLSAADGTLLAAGDAILSAPLADWLHARQARLHWSVLA